MSRPDTAAEYSQLVQALRDAVIRDFPLERSSRIWIMDESQSLDSQLEAAAIQFGFRDVAELRNQLESTDSGRQMMGLEPAMTGSAGGVCYTLTGPDGATIYVAFAGGYVNGEMVRDDNISVGRLDALMHEAGHAIYMSDPVVDARMNSADTSFDRTQVNETFATLFSMSILAGNGLVSREELSRVRAGWDAAAGEPMTLTGTPPIYYNATDEFDALDAELYVSNAASYSGTIGHLIPIYNAAVRITDAHAHSPEDLDQLVRLNWAMDRTMQLLEDNPEIVEQENIDPYNLSGYFAGRSDIFPQAARAAAGNEYITSEQSGDYRTLPMARPDLQRAAAQAWLDAQDGVQDSKDLVAEALFIALTAERDGITEEMQQTILDHRENNVWAEELLRGTDIVTALRDGINSIETNEAVPAHNPDRSNGRTL